MSPEHRFVLLTPGDPAPWFQVASTSNPAHPFDTTAGRYVVLCFFGSARDSAGVELLNDVMARRAVFDDQNMCFFGVSVDPADQASGRVRAQLPGIRFFWDFDGAVSRAYGASPLETSSPLEMPYRRLWLVLDPTLRVMRVFPMESAATIDAIFACLEALPPAAQHTGSTLDAPILILLNVFEADLCAQLIDLYRANGGIESGFMRQQGGKTIFVADPSQKRRKDYMVTERSVIGAIQARMLRRVVPEIAKVHQFQVTCMERYLVCCYSAEDGGHFGVHRDNRTKGTAHRRFAVSVNLNDDFDGGELYFPEYGPRRYKPALGAAVVFSCSLLHAVSKMERGQRYAFLPFLYDDAASAMRAENQRFVDWQGNDTAPEGRAGEK